MNFFDTNLWSNFVNDGELPSMEVETYIADDTLIKSGLIICALIIVTVLVIRATK